MADLARLLGDVCATVTYPCMLRSVTVPALKQMELACTKPELACPARVADQHPFDDLPDASHTGIPAAFGIASLSRGHPSVKFDF